MSTGSQPTCKGDFTPNSCNRVLVAEDDPVIRKILQDWLEKWGFTVVLAEDGERAWERLQDENPCALLLLDWVMPGIDGVELCRRVRGRHHSRYQYILLVTSRDKPNDVVKGLEAGADDYLTKPFEKNELRARLRVGKRILALQEDLIAAREALRFQATHDPLTGLWNGGTILEMLRRELERASRYGTSLAVIMLDIDHFKRVNDNHGHLTGDVVLREVAARLLGAVRSYDFVGRYGGEEFLLVLPDCGPEDVTGSAERVRDAVGDTPVLLAGLEIAVTVSLGATVAEPGISAEELVRRADVALYRAKNAGRNRTAVFS